MQQVSASEAEKHLAALLDQVEKGVEILITRNGEAVARLVPAISETDRERARAASERIRARARELKLGPFNWEELKADRDEGRP